MLNMDGCKKYSFESKIKKIIIKYSFDNSLSYTTSMLIGFAVSIYKTTNL